MKNDTYVNEYISNFLDNEPMPGIEYEYAMMNQLAPNIPVAAINQVMQQLITDNNQVVLLAGPEKEGVNRCFAETNEIFRSEALRRQSF